MSTAQNFGLQLLSNSTNSELEKFLDISIKLCKKLLLTDIVSISDVISIVKELDNFTGKAEALLPSIVIPHAELKTRIHKANYYFPESTEEDYV